MITEASLLAANWKLASGGVAVVLLAAADVMTPPQSIEDYSIKAMMAVVIVFLVRLLLKQQAEHKQEMKEERTQHQEKVVVAMEKQAVALEKMATQTEEQTTYFKTVTRNIVDQHIQGPHKTIP